MRVRFTLFPVKQTTVLPVNYTYFLTGLIYDIIGASSTDYSPRFSLHFAVAVVVFISCGNSC